SPLGEALANVVLGKIDAYEIDFFEELPFDVLPDWYTLLNAGCRIPLAGGSGKSTNSVALGGMRTFARLLPDEGFSYHSWIEAVRAGRTFVTNGPLISFTVNGHGPGSVINLTSKSERVRVHAEARSIVPFDRLEVILNGEVVADRAASGSPARASYEAELLIP